MGLIELDQRQTPSWRGRVIPGRPRGIRWIVHAGQSMALLSIFVVVAIVGTAAFMIWHSRQSELADHLRAMSSMGVVLAEQTSRYVQVIDLMVQDVQSKITTLEITTPDNFKRQLETEPFKHYLSERVKRVSQVDTTIVVIGADSQLINWSKFEPVGQVVTSERDYYRYFVDHDDPGLFIGSLSKSIVTGRLNLFFAHRVSGPDGRFLGLILAVVDIDYLSDFYKAAGDKLDQTVALLRNDGVMLIRYPNPELAIGVTLPRGSPWYQKVNEGGGSYLNNTTLKGVPSLVSVHLLRNYPLVVDILMDKTAVFAQWRREAVYICGFALAASLAFAVLFWTLGRQLHRLSESATLLSESEQILRSYAEMSVDWFWEQDADCRFKSDSGIPFMTGTDNTGKTRRDLGDPAMAEGRWTMHEADLAARRPFRDFRWERISPDGERHFLSSSGNPVFDRNGEFNGYRGTGRDISSEVKSAAQLVEANTQFETVLSSINQGICFFDGNKWLQVWNRRFAEIYNLEARVFYVGCPYSEMVALRYASGCAPDMPLAEYLALQELHIAAQQPLTFVLPLRNGRYIQISHYPMPDGGWVSTHEDITERHQIQESVLFMAQHDALTKLPNRSLFRERVEQAISMTGRGTPFAVFCIDLDKFKHINDTFGHPMGDALLVGVANRLRASVREVDTVARLGGDEFAIIQISLRQPDDSEVLASRIIAAFREPFELDGHQITSSVSLGIAVAPGDGVSYEGLMRDADIALYLAKAEHRGSARFFEPEMDARIHLRRLLELDLEAALARNEFELYYQPQVSLISNEVSGFEALLRWNHPVRGFVSPLEFIEVAEETGLIVAIGKWALRIACSEAERWPLGVSVAVNLSPIQFRGDLVATVKEALDISGLRPERLELEITESVFLGAAAETMEKLRNLRAMGISLALDDFGTGYSSLSYLRSFPVNKIKIDQSFIRDLATSKESMLIVRAVTGLGQSLGMMTIAEGVETQQQLDQLRVLGCTEVQGYFFGRPRPASEVPTVLEGFKQTPMVLPTAGWSSSAVPATSTIAHESRRS